MQRHSSLVPAASLCISRWGGGESRLTRTAPPNRGASLARVGRDPRATYANLVTYDSVVRWATSSVMPSQKRHEWARQGALAKL